MPNDSSNELICLLGPTASGKSDIAVEIAKEIPIEIISVDSALIYRGMDIGTAKPQPQIRARVAHHLIDIMEPNEYYSAAQFRKDALNLAGQIRQRQHVPLLVGGTMFYFHALEHGLSPMPESTAHTRAKLVERYKTTENLYKKLQSIDLPSAARIHPHDRQRVLRALSVCLEGEQTMSDYQSSEPTTSSALPTRYIALEFKERARLHQRIEERLNNMLQNGLLDEVAGLMMRGDMDAEAAAMRAIAYRQAWQYLLGDYNHAEMVQLILAASRQFAKRQLTWMRRMKITARYAVDIMSPKQIAAQIIKDCRHLLQ